VKIYEKKCKSFINDALLDNARYRLWSQSSKANVKLDNMALRKLWGLLAFLEQEKHTQFKVYFFKWDIFVQCAAISLVIFSVKALLKQQVVTISQGK